MCISWELQFRCLHPNIQCILYTLFLTQSQSLVFKKPATRNACIHNVLANRKENKIYYIGQCAGAGEKRFNSPILLKWIVNTQSIDSKKRKIDFASKSLMCLCALLLHLCRFVSLEFAKNSVYDCLLSGAKGAEEAKRVNTIHIMNHN